MKSLKTLEDELMNSFQVLWTWSSYKYIWIPKSHIIIKLSTIGHKKAKKYQSNNEMT